MNGDQQFADSHFLVSTPNTAYMDHDRNMYSGGSLPFRLFRNFFSIYLEQIPPFYKIKSG